MLTATDGSPFMMRGSRGLESQRTALLNHQAATLPIINTVLTVWQGYCTDGVHNRTVELV